MTIFKALSNVDSLVFYDVIINFNFVKSKLASRQIRMQIKRSYKARVIVVSPGFGTVLSGFPVWERPVVDET